MKIGLTAIVFCVTTFSLLTLEANDVPLKLGVSADQPLGQATIKSLIRKLESNSKAKRDEVKRKLITSSRLAAAELSNAIKLKREPLTSRAREVLHALPLISIHLRNAIDQPIGHVKVEFFLLKSNSSELATQPFAVEFSDALGGLSIPTLPQRSQSIALRTHIPTYGLTTITRLTSEQQSNFTTKNPSRLWLPVCPKNSDYSKRSVQGVIQDEGGQPIAGAEVQSLVVYTPNRWALKGIKPQSTVVTDDNGRFLIYHPCRYIHKEFVGATRVYPKFYWDPGISREIIPANSSYQLLVRVPHDLAYRPVETVKRNSSRAVIHIPRTKYSRQFQFKAIDGQPITDPIELSRITLRYHPPSTKRIWRHSTGWIELDDRVFLEPSPVHTGYYWASYRSDASVSANFLNSDEEVSWTIQKIDENTPEVLDFGSPPYVTFHGRVLDGRTDKPLAGVFIGGFTGHHADRDLADLTSDEWKAAERLPTMPLPNAEALRPFHKIFTFQKIVRTDDKGRFELVQEPDAKFYGVKVFARDKLLTSVRVFQGERFTDLRDILLFPAATLRLRNNTQSSINVGWSFPKTQQPKWFSRYKEYLVLPNGQQRYRQADVGSAPRIDANSSRSILISAETRIRLEGSINSNSWPQFFHLSKKVKFIDSTVYRFQDADKVDLGEIPLEDAISVRVKVVDPQGQPVAGVDVSELWTRGVQPVWLLSHATNLDGLVTIHLSPDTKSVKLQARSGHVFSIDSFEREFEVSWKDSPPKAPFRIQLSDEQMKILARRNAR